MTDRDIMQQALDALENGDVPTPENVGKNLDAITALRETLAQPECSHHFVRDEEAVKHYCCQKCGTVKVEQAIPEAEIYKREWVGLTEEEEERLIHNFGSDPHTLLDEVNARLKKRNT